MFQLIKPLLADTAATTAATQELTGFTAFFAQYGGILMLVVLFVVMYFFILRPQKKKQKEEQKMRDDVRVGDQITTIGGIMGRVVTVREDSLVIETGADRNKMTVKKWALQSNETVHEDKGLDDDDDDI